jgi:hypothetical protein
LLAGRGFERTLHHRNSGEQARAFLPAWEESPFLIGLMVGKIR